MADNLNTVWEKFFSFRSKPLWEKFPGVYRAAVVETNDPLRMHRVRVKCPDLHDHNLEDGDCPWAVPAFDFGTKRQGRWTHPCRGDWVWIIFERNNPYAPVWLGTANPTRRKFYPYPSVYGQTPVPVNNDGSPGSAPKDFNKDYMPLDSRPMSHGWQDRYGNLDMHSSVGFFPTEQAAAPAAPGYDAVQNSQFQASQQAPKANQPDTKYMVRMSKYGNMLMLGDQGYYWQSEFKGDFDADEGFENGRWKYIQQLLNEGVPASADGDGNPIANGDQRRAELKTRYGHKFELRDVGWAQQGPIASQSRQGEYGSPATLSQEQTNDFRWIKLRTKAGMLFQMYDKGADPAKDLFIQRKLSDECGPATEQEDQHWAKKDARFIRIVTRHGFKIVLDDRGSDDKDADGKETPRANGFLLKGRRTGAAATQDTTGDPRGFYLEFNENDQLNHLTQGSPLGQVQEFNDRYEYALLATSIGKDFSTSWQKVKENEFLLEPTMNRQPETNCHHLKLDSENEYIRFKTRAGNGAGPDYQVNPPSGKGINQGLEARDGGQGDQQWVELVDSKNRGLWFTTKYQHVILRSSLPTLLQYMDEPSKALVLWNTEGGPISINCKANIEINAGGNVNITAGGDVNVRAGDDVNITAGNDANISGGDNMNVQAGQFVSVLGGQQVRLQAADTLFTLMPGQIIRTNAKIEQGGEQANPADSATTAAVPTFPDQIAPKDRGQTYNGPFQKVDASVVEHPT